MTIFDVRPKIRTGPPIFVMDEADRRIEAKELISSMNEDNDGEVGLSMVEFLSEVLVSA